MSQPSLIDGGGGRNKMKFAAGVGMGMRHILVELSYCKLKSVAARIGG
jgi:hypothetical protein